MSKTDRVRKKVREVVLDVLNEDAVAGGSRPKKFRFNGDVYSAILGPDERKEGRLLLHVLLPERRPTDTHSGIRDDVIELQDYLESGIDIDLVPIPGYHTDKKIVYRVSYDSLLRAIL